MENNFDVERFLSYMEEEFPDVFAGINGTFSRDMLENIIEYGSKHANISKDELIYFLYDLVPEMSFSEIAMFANDEILSDHGKKEKEFFLKKYKEKLNF